MSDERAGLLDRVRRPEYTGANRCLPCTVLNVALALAGSVLLALAAVEFGAAAPAAALLAVAVLGVALAAIYLRGYLVPGTPALTARYLPESVLAALGAGHGPEVADGWERAAGGDDGADGGGDDGTGGEAGTDADGETDAGDGEGDEPRFETLRKLERERAAGIEPEPFLREVGAVEERGAEEAGEERGADAAVEERSATDAAGGRSDEHAEPELHLVEEFAAELRGALERHDGVPGDPAVVGALFDADREAVEPEEREYPAYRVGARIRKWPSVAALRLDLASDDALAAWTDRWADVPVRQRAEIRRLVRSLAGRCPDCGGELRETERVVESCCRSGTVVAVACADCEARVLEAAP